MSALLFDLGNSRLKWAVADQGRLSHHGLLLHGGSLDGERLAELVRLPRPERVFVSAVAHESLVVQLADWIGLHWDLAPEWAATKARERGLVNAYQDPSRMGVDRWLAMLAAREHCRGAFCLIDAGTAVTVDAVDRAGRHLGGWIAPGPHLMARSLTGGTGRVRSEYLAPPDAQAPDWGTGTVEGVALGVGHGFQGLMQQASERARASLGEDVQFLLTGGDGERVLQYLGPNATLAPHLVLEGLALRLRGAEGKC